METPGAIRPSPSSQPSTMVVAWANEPSPTGSSKTSTHELPALDAGALLMTEKTVEPAAETTLVAPEYQSGPAQEARRTHEDGVSRPQKKNPPVSSGFEE